MRSKWGGRCRAVALACVAVGLAGCELIANEVDRRLNGLADTPQPTSEENAYNRQFLVVDLHADTLMWRRGLADMAPTAKGKPLGQVDLQRMVAGNVGLQVLTMPTRVPTKNDALRCTDANGSDPAPLLAMASGWSPAAWGSPYHRALEQAQRLDEISRRPGPPSVTVIKTRTNSRIGSRHGSRRAAHRTGTGSRPSWGRKARTPSQPTLAGSSRPCTAWDCGWSARCTISPTSMAAPAKAARRCRSA